MPKPYVEALGQSLMSKPYVKPHVKASGTSLMSKPYVKALCRSLRTKPYVEALGQSLMSKPYVKAVCLSLMSQLYVKAKGQGVQHDQRDTHVRRIFFLKQTQAVMPLDDVLQICCRSVADLF